MPIRFDESKRIFQLDTKTSTYALMVFQENYLVHLYYGAKLPGDNLKHLMYRGRFDSLSPYNTKVDDPYFSVDINPMEYPANGAGDFRISANRGIRSPISAMCPIRSPRGSRRLPVSPPPLPGRMRRRPWRSKP